MPRTITASSKTQSQQTIARPFLLVEMVFDGGPVRVNSTDREIIAFGNTFLGIGRLGQVSAVPEHSDLQPTGMQFALTGIPSAYVSTVLSEQYQGRPVRMWIGFFAEDTYAVVVDPVLLFEGLIDQMALEIGETAAITLTAENRLIRWEQPNVRRYTNEDQQKRFPGDEGLEFIAQMVEKEIFWGRAGGAQGFPPGLTTTT